MEDKFVDTVDDAPTWLCCCLSREVDVRVEWSGRYRIERKLEVQMEKVAQETVSSITLMYLKYR